MMAVIYQNQAQIEVFESEIQQQNGMVYYNQKPLTGVMYSDDEAAVPNKCECTHEAHYKNGKLDGLKQEFYTNGILKYKGEFEAGKPVGKHDFFDKDGNPAKTQEYDSEGSYTEIIFNENGDKIGEGFYDKETDEKTIKYFKDDEIQKEETYKGKQLSKITYYENGHKKKEEIFIGQTKQTVLFDQNGIPTAQQSFDTATGQKSGTWVVFDETGQKKTEKVYQNNKVVKYQEYNNGKKDGKGFILDPNTGEKTEFLYKNGKLVHNRTNNPDYYIQNYDLQPFNHDGVEYKNIVADYYDKINKEHKYYLIQVPDPEQFAGNDKPITSYIISTFLSRPTELMENEYGGEKMLSGIIRLKNIKTEVTKKYYDWNKTVKGKSVKYKEWGYKVFVNFKVEAFNMAHEKIFEADYMGRSKPYPVLKSIALRLLYPKDPSEAINMALSDISIYSLNVEFFPVVSSIKKVKKRNSKGVKYVYIGEGTASHVLKGAYFNIYDEDHNKFVKKIRITKSKPDEAIGKVLDNRKWLDDYIKNHDKVYVKETKK